MNTTRTLDDIIGFEESIERVANIAHTQAESSQQISSFIEERDSADVREAE